MAGADIAGPENPLPPARRMPRWQRAIGIAVVAVLAARDRRDQLQLGL